MDFYGGGGWMWPFYMIFGGMMMLLFWGGIIALVVWGIRSLSGERRSREEPETPLEIVRRRYARGEITREEFERLRDDLS